MAKRQFTGGGTSRSKKSHVESIAIPDILEPPTTIQLAQSMTHTKQVVEIIPLPAVDGLVDDNATAVHNGQVDADGWEDELHDVIQLESRDGAKAQTKNKKKLMLAGLTRWLAFRESYLEELLCFDGPGTQDIAAKCELHNQATAMRCLDCFGGKLEGWNGQFFERISLAHIGLRVQLGHHSGRCFQNQCGPVRFTVLDVSGTHHVNVDFCRCGESPGGWNECIQLLRVGWYPATTECPRTAFTFDYLNTFHLLTLQGKLNLYDYYKAILRKTDNIGLQKQVYRWNEVSMVVRQWRHLKSVKRAGHGHNPAGIAATKPGACAVECPACPHPGINLPVGWESLPNTERWLYQQVVAMDACFHLKLKARGFQDPELGSGWLYFVGEGSYQEYLAICKDQHEISMCESELNAVNQAYSKGTHDSLSVTGIIGVKCARHCFVLPNGIGDLQKGEQYCNVDYVVLSALKASRITEDQRALPDIGFSYDITCNWYKNFYKRLDDMPEHMQILDGIPTCTMIPKAHIEGHGPKCHTTWSFNFLRGVGRTHSETVEQEWAHIGQVGISTREMGPAARHSVLDDHWSTWNWHKLVDLESHLVKHLAEALLMTGKQKVIAEKFTSTFSPATIEKWRQMVAEWDLDKTKPDPYAEPSASTMMAMIQLKLAEEEVIEAMHGEPQLHDKLTVSAFVRLGLELEERQRALCIKGEGVLRNPLKRATLQEKRNALTRHIHAWSSVQPTYQPVVTSLHGVDSLAESANASPLVHAEDLKLYLPSELAQAQREVGCCSGIIEKEHRFRMAQVEDALEDVHHLRRIYAGLLAKYRINIASTGQKANTRSKMNIRAFNLKITLTIARYHDARRALLVLDSGGEWKTRFQEFKDGDN
ncbi:hypothetical protein SCP_0109400 [Sparassis crispa]|uniref:CxC2-like cysteine cluster KDZ transposase-associated domain-containing protein n=1 Tax=Sparassis crispa TaxID=139825 RepID=A0A401G7D3_9APHY|nr:hypothetical protein SCP_0109400 [Sparassis crispa]GBE78058.1 hypothetical protein SCP_0109400 [Sparassis crispa]